MEKFLEGVTVELPHPVVTLIITYTALCLVCGFESTFVINLFVVERLQTYFQMGRELFINENSFEFMCIA